jgi:hypothetical protein
MVMFLDQSPAEPLLRLGERLGVAVVVETSLGVFEVHSAPVDSELARMFPAVTGSDAKREGTPNRE